jgi:hypothetical protein
MWPTVFLVVQRIDARADSKEDGCSNNHHNDLDGHNGHCISSVLNPSRKCRYAGDHVHDLQRKNEPKDRANCAQHAKHVCPLVVGWAAFLARALIDRQQNDLEMASLKRAEREHIEARPGMTPADIPRNKKGPVGP